MAPGMPLVVLVSPPRSASRVPHGVRRAGVGALGRSGVQDQRSQRQARLCRPWTHERL